MPTDAGLLAQLQSLWRAVALPVSIRPTPEPPPPAEPPAGPGDALDDAADADDEREAAEERAAIMQHDGELPQALADWHAGIDAVEYPPLACPRCGRLASYWTASGLPRCEGCDGPPDFGPVLRLLELAARLRAGKPRNKPTKGRRATRATKTDAESICNAAS